jgi:hypothetical protein
MIVNVCGMGSSKRLDGHHKVFGFAGRELAYTEKASKGSGRRYETLQKYSNSSGQEMTTFTLTHRFKRYNIDLSRLGF